MGKRLKQKNVPWLGVLVDSLYTALPILSILNFLSIMTILYASIKMYLFQWAPGLTFGWFILLIGALTSILVVFVYFFVIPSLWTFRQRQMFGYDSKLRDEVVELKDGVGELKSEVMGLKDEIKKLVGVK